MAKGPPHDHRLTPLTRRQPATGGGAARRAVAAGTRPGAGHGQARAARRVGATFLAVLDTTIVNIAFADLRADFPDASLSQLT